MKIAIFHELPPGGARIAVNEIAKGLKKKHEVDLYYVDDKKNLSENEYYTHIHFYKFIPKVWEGNNWQVRLYKDTVELYTLFKLHKKIAEEISKKQYDILFVNASRFIESPFILRFPNTKKVFYLHDPHDRALYEKDLMKKEKVDFLRQVYDSSNKFIRKIIDKQNLNGADNFLANSNFTQKMFRKTYGKNSIVSYLGVDTNFFIPKNVEKEFDLLYIGSHEPVDGYSLLEEALMQMKKKPKVRTVFFEDEWLTTSELRNLYRKSKIVLALGKNEPFGLIPLEAMACGVPVIAIAEGGYKETVLDDKTGYLIPRNGKELAKKITYLLSYKKIRLDMGKYAQKYIKEKWTWEKCVEQIERNVKNMLSK